MRSVLAFALLAGLVTSQGPPALVSTARATLRDFAPTLVAVGKAEASLHASASAELQARVLSVKVDAGAVVDPTRVLVELDRSVFLIAKQRAKAELDLAQSKLDEFEAGARPEELAAARARLEEAQAQQREAQREYRRIKELVDGGSSSAEELSSAQAAEERSAALANQRKAELALLVEGPRKEVKAAQRAEVAIRTAALSKAEDDLKRCTLRSPITGVVTRRTADPGQVVMPGAALLEIAVIDPIRVVVPAPERIVGLLKAGVRVPVRFDAHPERHFDAEVEAVMPDGDPVARTFSLRLRLPNPKGELLPGMLARADLPVRRAGKLLAVPRDAVLSRPRGAIVWTVVDGKAQVVSVVPGYEKDGWVSLSGTELKEGAEVVTAGNVRLRRGQAVQKRPAEGQGR